MPGRIRFMTSEFDVPSKYRTAPRRIRILRLINIERTIPSVQLFAGPAAILLIIWLLWSGDGSLG